MDHGTEKSSEITISFALETMADEVCVVQVTMTKKERANSEYGLFTYHTVVSTYVT
jgi:hypothetical protein